MKDSNFIDLQHEIEECFNRYSLEFVWSYMKNRENIDGIYPKIVNDLYDIIIHEKSKIESE